MTEFDDLTVTACGTLLLGGTCASVIMLSQAALNANVPAELICVATESCLVAPPIQLGVMAKSTITLIGAQKGIATTATAISAKSALASKAVMAGKALVAAKTFVPVAALLKTAAIVAAKSALISAAPILIPVFCIASIAIAASKTFKS